MAGSVRAAAAGGDLVAAAEEGVSAEVSARAAGSAGEEETASAEAEAKVEVVTQAVWDPSPARDPELPLTLRHPATGGGDS